MPLGPLVFQTSKNVSKFTGKTIKTRFLAQPHADGESTTDGLQQHDTTLRRLLHKLDAAAASTLRKIDSIIVLVFDSTGVLRQWIIHSTSQMKDLAAYFHRTYYQEARKWSGAGDVVIFCGAISFTVAVAIFDVTIFVAEWFFDGREGKRVERRIARQEVSHV